MILHVYELYGNFRVFYLKQCLVVKKKDTRNVTKNNLLKNLVYSFLRDICHKKKTKLKLFYSFILKDRLSK